MFERLAQSRNDRPVMLVANIRPCPKLRSIAGTGVKKPIVNIGCDGKLNYCPWIVVVAVDTKTSRMRVEGSAKLAL